MSRSSLPSPSGDTIVEWMEYLDRPARFSVKGKRVAVIGGGAVALDCAEEALAHGARSVEMFALETWSEMPLTAKERRAIEAGGIAVTGRVRVLEILKKGKPHHRFEAWSRWRCRRERNSIRRNVVDVKGTERIRPDADFVIIAAGARSSVGEIE